MYRYGGTAAAAILERVRMSAGVTHLALRELPRRLFPGAAAVSALPRRGVRRPTACTRRVVEEVSVIRHMLGQENWQPRRIASVRAADGLRMTVGLSR